MVSELYPAVFGSGMHLVGVWDVINDKFCPFTGVFNFIRTFFVNLRYSLIINVYILKKLKINAFT